MYIKQELDKSKFDYGQIYVSMDGGEEDTFFVAVIEHIRLMPKAYRNRNMNWCIVSDLTTNGSGYSAAICKYLGVDPDSYVWERKQGKLTLLEFVERGGIHKNDAYPKAYIECNQGDEFVLEQLDWSEKNICPLFKDNDKDDINKNNGCVPLTNFVNDKWMNDWIIDDIDQTDDDEGNYYIWLEIKRKPGKKES